MFTHYLKIALRNVLKNKTQSIISIIGLMVSFACITLSAIWIKYETSYDASFPDAKKTYLLANPNKNDTYLEKYYFDLSGQVSLQIPQLFPEVKHIANVERDKGMFETPNGQAIECVAVDTAFFTVFPMKFIIGSKESAFNQLKSVVLNESTAKKIFGSAEGAFGKTLKSYESQFNRKTNGEYTVTGVIQDIKHTNLYLDALIPIDSKDFEKYFELEGGTANITAFKIYIQLKDNVSKESFLHNLRTEESLKKTTEDIELAPITELKYKYMPTTFNSTYILVLAIIVLLLFICAIINYTSVFISSAYTRLKNIGLRRALGSSTPQLYLLLITEFLFTLLAGFLLGICFTEILRPVIENVTGIEISISTLINTILVFIVCGVVLSLIFISYPILRISTKAVKQNMTGKNPMGQQAVQKLLISVQLVISIFFLFITSVMFYQVTYVKQKDLGMNIVNTLVITPDQKLMNDFTNKIDVIFTELKQNTNIKDAIKLNSLFIQEKNVGAGEELYNWEERDDPDNKIKINDIIVGADFADFFGIKVIDGRFFSDKFENEYDKVLVNQQFANLLEKPIGKTIFINSYSIVSDPEPRVIIEKRPHEIIGIISDIQTQSFKYESLPTIVTFGRKWYTNICIRYEKGKTNEALNAAETIMKKHGINDYTTEFLEDRFVNFIKTDTIMMRIISIIAAICLLISIFGVYSLTLFTMERRRREVAIRKVMGASVADVIRMFFKEYILMVVIAAIIAIPPAYYIIDKWFQSYASRVGISWCLIAGILIITAIIVIVTVLRQIIKSANSNPAEVIKYE